MADERRGSRDQEWSPATLSAGLWTQERDTLGADSVIMFDRDNEDPSLSSPRPFMTALDVRNLESQRDPYVDSPEVASPPRALLQPDRTSPSVNIFDPAFLRIDPNATIPPSSFHPPRASIGPSVASTPDAVGATFDNAAARSSRSTNYTVSSASIGDFSIIDGFPNPPRPESQGELPMRARTPGSRVNSTAPYGPVSADLEPTDSIYGSVGIALGGPDEPDEELDDDSQFDFIPPSMPAARAERVLDGRVRQEAGISSGSRDTMSGDEARSSRDEEFDVWVSRSAVFSS